MPSKLDQASVSGITYDLQDREATERIAAVEPIVGKVVILDGSTRYLMSLAVSNGYLQYTLVEA